MNIKNRIIKQLGGHTHSEYLNKDEDFPTYAPITSVYTQIKSYNIDDDTMDVEKEQLAYKIGKEMLDRDLIDYSIKESKDAFGCKIYIIRAKAYVKDIK